MLTLLKSGRIVDVNHNEDDQLYDVLIEDEDLTMGVDRRRSLVHKPFGD